MARPLRQPDCHPERRHLAKGYCEPCYRRQWRAADPEARARRDRAYHQRHPDRVSARRRAWEASHRGAYLAGKQRNYVRHRDAYAAANKTWRAANPEKQRAAEQRWRERHPDRAAGHAARMRAMRQAAPVFEYVSRLVVLEIADSACALCGREVDPRDFHLDHILSLAAGGWHGYDNVQLTHPECNLRKGSR